jgi:hypothetical protein
MLARRPCQRPNLAGTSRAYRPPRDDSATTDEGSEDEDLAGEPGPTDDLAEWRYWRAQHAKIKCLREQGELVPAGDRDALLAQRALEFRRGLETALLHRLPPRLAALSDPVEIVEVLEDVIRELLERYTRPCS